MVCYYLPPIYSGAGRQAWQLAKALRDRCDVFFLTARHDDSEPVEQCDGINIYRLAALGVGQWFAFVWSLRLAWRLAWWRHRYDLVHTHGYPLFYFIPMAVLRLLGKPNLYKLSMAGSDDPAALFAGRLGWVRRLTYPWINVKVAISTELVARCRQLPTAVVGRVEQIPNGIDTNRFRPATERERREFRERFGWGLTQRVAVFAGALVERKGIHTLLRAWAVVLRRVTGAQLLLVGPAEYVEHGRISGASYWAALQRLVAELGIGDRVTFVGGREDVEVFLRCADVCCLASQQEGLPNVFLEALASGTPVVAFEVAGVADTVVDGVTGLRVAPQDGEAFAQALVRLLSDDILRIQMQGQARSLAVAKFSLETVAERYTSLYQELIVE